MRLSNTGRASLILIPFLATLLAQRGFREYPYEEVNPTEVPPDANERNGMGLRSLALSLGPLCALEPARLLAH